MAFFLKKISLFYTSIRLDWKHPTSSISLYLFASEMRKFKPSRLSCGFVLHHWRLNQEPTLLHHKAKNNQQQPPGELYVFFFPTVLPKHVNTRQSAF